MRDFLTKCLLTMGTLSCITPIPLRGGEGSLSYGKTYTASVAAVAQYPDDGTKLTDGFKDPSGNYSGGAWQGRNNRSFSQSIDLEKECTVKTVIASFTQRKRVGIVYPTRVRCSYYDSSRGYVVLGDAVKTAINNNYAEWRWTGETVQSRYIRVEVWNGGNGWIFQDEVEVRGEDAAPAGPSSLSYPLSNLTLVKDRPMAALKPQLVGQANQWTVTPALPAGLALDSATGIISGTPTQEQTSLAYTITAASQLGSATTVVNVAVQTAPPEDTSGNLPYPLHGITVDDTWTGDNKLNQIVTAIKAMSVKPTVRIVMNDEIDPSAYVNTFKSIHEVAYVMACPVDSYYMKGFATVAAYEKRFADSFTYLAPYVDLWEIGNEINGEGWLGKDKQFIADKMYSAYKYIREKGGKTVLTGYETKPESASLTMGNWMRTYVPEDMKAGLDYMVVSYYEDDNEGYQPNWTEVFKELESIFPKAKLAIGECGNTAKTATTESKVAMVKHYYTMPNPVKNFVGGYFWWAWVQDCVPYRNNQVWEAINTYMQQQPAYQSGF